MVAVTLGRFSRGVAGVAGLLTIVVSATQVLGPVVTIPGVVILLLGARNDSRTVCRFGAGITFLGVLITSSGTGFPVLALAAAALLVLAWDSAEYAVSIGTVPAGTETERVELVHAAATTLVLTVVGSAGYVVYRFAPERLAGATVVVLILGAAVLTALRE